MYTARQWYGITQLVPAFPSQLMEILVIVNIRPLAMLKKPLATLWQTLWSNITEALSRSAFLGVLISAIAPGQCGAFVLITFSCELLLYAYYHLIQNVNYANQYPSSNYWKYLLVPRSCAFSEGDVENYWSVTSCHLKRRMQCSCWQQPYPWATWTSIEEDHIKRKLCPSPYH